MTTIAHLTDFHLLEARHADRSFAARARLSYLSFGRALDAGERRARVANRLEEVRAHGVDHVLITGDLTEDGHAGQFEVLAELLADSRIPAERITIVPGNHDAYIDGAAFGEAMQGPLRAYAATSAIAAPLQLRDVTIVPVSTAFHQSPLRSAGAIAPDQLASLAGIANDPRLAAQPLIFAQHHPPGRAFLPLVQWIDGLCEHAALSDLFERCPHLHVMHGHTHHHTDRAVRAGEAARVFSAEAVVNGAAPVRYYDVSPAGVFPLASPGVNTLAPIRWSASLYSPT